MGSVFWKQREGVVDACLVRLGCIAGDSSHRHSFSIVCFGYIALLLL